MLGSEAGAHWTSQGGLAAITFLLHQARSISAIIATTDERRQCEYWTPDIDSSDYICIATVYSIEMIK